MQHPICLNGSTVSLIGAVFHYANDPANASLRMSMSRISSRCSLSSLEIRSSNIAMSGQSIRSSTRSTLAKMRTAVSIMELLK